MIWDQIQCELFGCLDSYAVIEQLRLVQYSAHASVLLYNILLLKAPWSSVNMWRAGSWSLLLQAMVCYPRVPNH